MVTWRVVNGDMLVEVDKLEPASIDACVCDPPYEINLMGRTWDSSGVSFAPKTWAKVYRVLKPGGHLLAFAGARTYHRIAVAIEDAGFEIRDCIEWVYGTGYPKSLDLSKSFDKQAGLTEERGYLDKPTGGLHMGSGATVDFSRGPGRQLADNPVSANAKKWDGWGSALKPAHEPIVVARKPLIGNISENVAKYGTGAMNIEATRVPPGRWPPNLLLDPESAMTLDAQSGTLFGPPAFVRKSTGTGRAAWGPILRTEVGEMLNGYGDVGGASKFFPVFEYSVEEASFAYVPKPDTPEREAGVTPDGLSGPEVATGPSNWKPGETKLANDHPSLKPIALLRWLCRLMTPPGGTVLDPFAGVSSTGCAARLEGFKFIGIELDARYARIGRERIAYWEAKAPAAMDVPQIPAALKVSPSKQASLEAQW